MIEWLSLAVALCTLALSWWWHRQDGKSAGRAQATADAAVRAADAAAGAQQRIANAVPWTVERTSAYLVLLTNRTGEDAADVQVVLDRPWYFVPDDAAPGGEVLALAGGYEEHSTRLELAVVRAGSNRAFRVTVDESAGLDVNGHVFWTTRDGLRREWTFSILPLIV